jgi:heptosyltransferase-1
MNRILAVRLRKLGDIVFTLPALELLRQAFPAAELHYLVEPPYQGLVTLFGALKIREITVPRAGGLGELYRIRRALRRERYDAAIDFHSGPRSALLTYLSGAACRVGYRTPNRNWAYNRMVARKTIPPGHSVDNQLRLLAALGITHSQRPPFPELSVSAERIAPEIRALAGGGAYIVVHIGAGNSFRDWGEQKFSQLADRLRARRIRTLLVGDAAPERERAGRIADGEIVLSLRGRLAFEEFLFLVERSRLFVGVDSGPLHLASLTSAPLLALYGPNITAVSGPYRTVGVTIVERDLECRPCDQRTCLYGDIRCLQHIEVDDVFTKIVGLL